MSEAAFLRPLIAEALRPPPRMTISQWAEQYRVVPSEASANPGRWSNERNPYLTEIMDCLSPWHPCLSVTLAKSAQVGGTEVAFNFMGAIADMWPGPTMMVQETIDTAQKWSRTKLSPSLRVTERLRRKVTEQKSRDGSSTTLHKSFPGGYWMITGANSAASLSSNSIRFLIKDEWDKWTHNVDGQGDPDSLVNQRLKTFHDKGLAKIFQLSTPLLTTTKDGARVWPAYLAGDQRNYFVPCPHCAHEQTLYFFPKKEGEKKIGGLRFEKSAPLNPLYACEACGALIEQYQLREMVSKGHWIPQNPGPGRQPSFHINVLYTTVPWEKAVETFLAAGDNLLKLRAFYNLELGLPWEERGDAPEWERLYSLREDYPLRAIPAGGIVLTCACDVQQNGIYYETVAWGKDKQSWSIDIGFLEGEPADEDDKVWKDLHALYKRIYPDAYGNYHGLDAFGIDSGYITHLVYQWTRTRYNTFALDGRHGWTQPAMGAPVKKDVDYKGRKDKNGVVLWPVGTWPLKSQLYANLRKQGIKEGKPENPESYCHFSVGHPDKFFQQLTAESRKEKIVKGRPVNGWVASGPNHYHDCRIYNMALADQIGVNLYTPAEWARIEENRRKPKMQQHELFGQRAEALLPPKTEEAPKKPTEASGRTWESDDWLTPKKDW